MRTTPRTASANPAIPSMATCSLIARYGCWARVTISGVPEPVVPEPVVPEPVVPERPQPGLDPGQPGSAGFDLGIELGPAELEHPTQLCCADLLGQHGADLFEGEAESRLFPGGHATMG